MKKITIVTNLPFWRANRGSLQRVLNQIHALKTSFNLTVLFLGDIGYYDARALSRLKLNSLTKSVNDYSKVKKTIKPSLLPRALKDSYKLETKERFFGYLKEEEPEAIIIHNIDNYYLTAGEKLKCRVAIDTHDIRSERVASFDEIGISSEMSITKDEEFHIFDSYDAVIAIQEDDKNSLIKWGINESKVVVCGHALRIANEPTSVERVKNISYFGSHNKSNIDAIEFFMENVWFCFKNEDLTLNIYGGVCEHVRTTASKYKNITVHGMISDLEAAYSKADILINPVRCGSGLKIKNVEALAYGKPLITTKEGARGINDGINKSFLLANSDIDNIKMIIGLVRVKELRDTLSINAIEYSRSKFSFQSAFKDLKEFLA